jgi:hypothetical protein
MSKRARCERVAAHPLFSVDAPGCPACREERAEIRSQEIATRLWIGRAAARRERERELRAARQAKTWPTHCACGAELEQTLKNRPRHYCPPCRRARDRDCRARREGRADRRVTA